MHAWTVYPNPLTGTYGHKLDIAHGHSLLVPLVTSVFQELGVSASLNDGRYWWSIYSCPSLVLFEVEHGVETQRWKYNHRCFAQVLARKQRVLGEHAGYRDYFVPVIARGVVVAILVAGPFALTRPQRVDILDQWRRMTGRKGDPADPAFLAYLRAILSMLVLDGSKRAAFEELLECLAKLLGGEGQADKIMNRAHVLRVMLEPARFVERGWEAAREMVDERSTQAHYSGARAHELRSLGLARAPDHVLVGLAKRRSRAVDAVEEAVACDALQRAVVEIAHSAGDAIAGQVGDHGMFFLSASRGSPQAKKRRLLSLGAQASSLAEQRFGLALHLGASLGSGGEPLSRVYQEALGAAESALAVGASVVMATPDAPGSGRALRVLRRELTRDIEEDPGKVAARFDRYLEAVAARSSYGIETARAQLDIGFEHMAEALTKSGALDERSLQAMCDGLDRAASQTRALRELFVTYRDAVTDLVAAVRNPTAARRNRGLRSAIKYIHQHYAEPLGLPAVAHIAGYEAKHFSRMFRKREGVTFEGYVVHLRLERAKHLLTGTDLSVRRVAELSGLKTPQYLCRLFRRVVGMTPLGYRARVQPEWMDPPRRRRGSTARGTRMRKSRADGAGTNNIHT